MDGACNSNYAEIDYGKPSVCSIYGESDKIWEYLIVEDVNRNREREDQKSRESIRSSAEVIGIR